MKKLIPLFLILAGGASAFACGSDGNSGAACVPAAYQAEATPACTSCVESSCSTQYQALCNAHCNSGAAGGSQLSNECLSALQAVGSCADQKCQVCTPAEAGGSGSTGAGGTSNSSGGSGTTGSGKACSIGGAICNWYPASLPASSVESACTQASGTLSDHCPSASLAGCCAMPSATICYYSLSDATSLQSACAKAGGNWGTSPP